MTKYKYTDDMLKVVVKESNSYVDVLRKLNIKPAGGNYTTIRNKVKRLGLDISHFIPYTSHLMRYKKGNGPTRKALKDILTGKVSYVNTNRLKIRLFDSDIKEKRCEVCGRTSWNGTIIPLELHHIDGNRENNLLENLQIVCPNCHALTKNYRGAKNKNT